MVAISSDKWRWGRFGDGAGDAVTGKGDEDSDVFADCELDKEGLFRSSESSGVSKVWN